MNNQSFPEDFDQFFEQTLDAAYDGPVSEVVLRRLLSAVELVLRRELAQKAPNQELAGLRIGYLFQEAGNETDAQLYWVGWGYHPTYDEILDRQLEIFGKTVNYPDISGESVNFLSDDLARKLVHKLHEEMLCYAPVGALQGNQIYPFVFGHVVRLFASGFMESSSVMLANSFKCNTTCNNKPGFKPPNKPCHNSCVE